MAREPIEGVTTSKNESSTSTAVERIDLAALEHIRRGRLPVLEAIADRYLRSLRIWALRELNWQIPVGAASVDVIRFHQFTNARAPSTLALFRLAPLPGTTTLSLSPDFVSAIIERAFGGMKKSARSPRNQRQREPSALEHKLVAKRTAALLALLPDAFAAELSLTPSEATFESNPLALTHANGSDRICRIAIQFEEQSTQPEIVFCIPMSTLAPVRHRLLAERPVATGRSHGDTGLTQPRLCEALMAVPAEVRVVLGSTKMPCGAILALQVGDVIQLTTGPTDGVDVQVENSSRFVGTLGISRGNQAVTIRERRKV